LIGRFFKVEENICFQNAIGYSGRCKFLQRWRCVALGRRIGTRLCKCLLLNRDWMLTFPQMVHVCMYGLKHNVFETDIFVFHAEVCQPNPSP
jgi:hypothetical protein